MSNHPYFSHLQEAEKVLGQTYQHSRAHYDGLLAGLQRVNPKQEGLTQQQMDEITNMVQRLQAKIAEDMKPIVGATGRGGQ